MIAHSAASRDALSSEEVSGHECILPFHPRSYRDFMLYEAHFINAARGFVKKYMPKLAPAIAMYEKAFKKPFPKLKPKNRWYTYPIYYMGNHLNFVTDKCIIKIPEYTRELDYELELGAVITAPLKNASPEEAENAIGGFVVFNDFSARDVQLEEMDSGFGPMKTKNMRTRSQTPSFPRTKYCPGSTNLQAKSISTTS